jgi:hypothetical protein
MEKYSVFNDRVSGVNPFAPTVYRPGAAAVAIGGAIVLLRAPFLLITGALLGLTAALADAVRACGIVGSTHAGEA